VKARVGALGEPAVELVLVVELRDEAAGRLEAALEEVMQTLERALRVRLRLRLIALLGSDLSV